MIDEEKLGAYSSIWEKTEIINQTRLNFHSNLMQMTHEKRDVSA